MRVSQLPQAQLRSVRAGKRTAAEARDIDPAAHAEMLRETRLLEAAELYWVSEEMTYVALDAARDIPRWSPDIAPTPIGLIFFDDGLPDTVWLDAPDDLIERDGFGRQTSPRVPIDYLLWWVSGDELMIAAGCENRRVGEYTDAYADMPLVPLWQLERRFNPEPDAPATHDESSSVGELAITVDERQRVIELLAATWALMAQTNVSSVRRVREGGGKGRRQAPPTDVTIVTLRQMRHVDVDRDEETGRVYTHRWIVRGHWRQQPHGPNKGQRRPQWIPSYIKGPAGTPLRRTQRVTVWRR